MSYVEIGLQKFIDDNFDGNRKCCSIEIKISESTLSRIIKGKSCPGIKVSSNIMKYCKMQNIDYSKYISY